MTDYAQQISNSTSIVRELLITEKNGLALVKIKDKLLKFYCLKTAEKYAAPFVNLLFRPIVRHFSITYKQLKVT